MQAFFVIVAASLAWCQVDGESFQVGCVELRDDRWVSGWFVCVSVFVRMCAYVWEEGVTAA